jgi:serine/threonine protein phosphatase PrpC
MNEWRYIYASVKGTSHDESGTPCQDYASCRNWSEKGIFAAVVADGAGSASHAEQGATLACSVALSLIEDYLQEDSSLSEFSQDQAEAWTARIAEEIGKLAQEESLSSRDFACTFLMAVVGKDSGFFLQVGDGAIVVALEEEYTPVFWPQSGEYVNATYFVTDQEVIQHLRFQVLVESITEVALLSDGLQMLALQFSEQSAYTPFFRPMFAQLALAPVGNAEQLSIALANFLNSEPVNNRTDDDKTLVLATRRQPVLSIPIAVPASETL